MKYAIFNGVKSEAFKHGRGSCPLCEEVVIAKCGNIKIHHWAHKGKKNCDVWWENETEWHREWKSQFPKEWQEVVLSDKHGKKHRADIHNPSKKLTIEFQNSSIGSDEIRARERFYQKMIWVVNAKNFKIEFEDFNSILDEVETIRVKCLNDRVNDRIEVSKEAKEKLINFSNEIKQSWNQGFSEQLIKDILKQFNYEVDKAVQRLFDGKPTDSLTVNANQLKHEILLPIFDKGIIAAKDYARKKEELGYYKYNWIRRKKVWSYAKQPVFLDTGKELLLLKSDQVLKIVSKKTFIEKYSQQ